MRENEAEEAKLRKEYEIESKKHESDVWKFATGTVKRLR